MGEENAKRPIYNKVIFHTVTFFFANESNLFYFCNKFLFFCVRRKISSI